MSCFGGRVSQDLYQNCCNSHVLCEFDGDISSLKSEPIYVQKVFDAVEFHLQGMKSVSGQVFSPCIPCGYRVKRVIDIRCKRSFNPENVDDESNLKLNVNTSISGATFLKNGAGDILTVVGADGNLSEKLLYAETSDCDDKCMGTPIFGTQNICITGDVIVELDLLLCDSCNHETIFTVCSEVNVAEACQPLVLTNFFEICMPSAIDTAFLPRFTEFCNSACETRLATNNHGRDLCIDANGQVSANLIIAICVTCEKKIVVPVQLCVLSTGYVQAEVQQNAVCQSFPTLFPNQIRPSDTIENCGQIAGDTDNDCGCGTVSGGSSNQCGCGCNTGCDCECDPCGQDCCDPCADCDPCCDGQHQHRPNRPQRPQPRR